MFSKDCPQCGKDNAAYAVRCACGYLFGAMDDSVETDDGHAQTVQEEKLYEEYLKARAEQAASSAREAARIAATQPGNRVRVEQAAQAKLAAAKVEAELAAQRAKLDAVTPDPPKTGVEAPAQETAARPKSASPMPGISAPSRRYPVRNAGWQVAEELFSAAWARCIGNAESSDCAAPGAGPAVCHRRILDRRRTRASHPHPSAPEPARREPAATEFRQSAPTADPLRLYYARKRPLKRRRLGPLDTP